VEIGGINEIKQIIMTKTPFKMKGFSGFKSPVKQRDTSLTGGIEENVIHGGQVSFLNPQYTPGHQRGGSDSKEAPKKKKAWDYVY